MYVTPTSRVCGWPPFLASFLSHLRQLQKATWLDAPMLLIRRCFVDTIPLLPILKWAFIYDVHVFLDFLTSLCLKNSYTICPQILGILYSPLSFCAAIIYGDPLTTVHCFLGKSRARSLARAQFTKCLTFLGTLLTTKPNILFVT